MHPARNRDPQMHISEEGVSGRKPKTPMQIMLLILFGFIGLGLLNSLGARLHGTPEEQAATYPVQPGNSAKTDAIAFYKQVQGITEQCELAGGLRALATVGVKAGGDPVSLYQTARREDAACLGVSSHLKGLQIPESLGRPVALAFTKALDVCESAYLAQWSAAHALAGALNSGGKMDDIATFRDSDADAKADNSRCYNSLADAPAALGVTRTDLGALPALNGQAAPSSDQPVPVVPQPEGSYPMPYMKDASPSVQRMLNRWNKLNEQCQGGINETPEGPVCTARDNAGLALEQAGWCFGGPNDTAAERIWKPCSMVQSGQ